MISPLAAPSAVTLDTRSVAENSAAGTLIGTLGTSDTDVGDAFTYKIVKIEGGVEVDDATTPFEIQTTGTGAAAVSKLVVKQGAVLDFETLTTYAIKIKSTDSTNLSVTTDFTISVTNVNDPPVVTISNTAIAELSSGGSEVGAITVTDQSGTSPDTGGPFFYDLVDDQGNRIDHPVFQLRAGTATTPWQIVTRTTAVLDRETTSLYPLKLKVTDAGGVSTIKDVVIDVTNVNEAPTDVRLDRNEIREMSPYGTVVGRLIVTDQDVGDTFTYQIVNNAGAPVTNARFEIVAAGVDENGRAIHNLIYKQDGAALDFEAQNTYNLNVKVTDAGNLTTTKQISVRVTNVNEAPFGIQVTGGSISEDARPGTVVGWLETDDPDDNDLFTYQIVDANNAPIEDGDFEIIFDPSVEAYAIVVKQGATLDRETLPAQILRVKVTDAGGLSYIKDLTVNIDNAQEIPVITAPSVTRDVVLREGSPSVMLFTDVSIADSDGGRIFASVRMDDPTKGQFTNITTGSYDRAAGIYTVVGSIQNVTNALKALIFVANDRMNVSANNVIETMKFTLTVSDDTFVVKSPADVRVNIDASRAPTDITLNTALAQELAASNAVVGTLSTTDGNTDEVFTYTLLDNAGGRFKLLTEGTVTKIVVDNGLLLDFEQATQHTIKVKSVDRQNLSVEKDIVIGVGDVGEETTAGSTANDNFLGGAGKDNFAGGDGNDTLNGGANDDTLAGAAGDDSLIGGDANDRISGGVGNDSLTGGSGADIFIFDTARNKTTNVDTITDFSVADDSIYLDNAIFTRLGASGTLEVPVKVLAANFVVGSRARDKNDYLIYNKTTGILTYDANGSGRGGAIAIAKIGTNLDLTIDDLFVI